jgi:hypothetical protein
MQAFIVFTAARMIEGEFLFISARKGFTDKEKADDFAKQLSDGNKDTNGKLRITRISTPTGEADCFCEVGVHEVEID